MLDIYHSPLTRSLRVIWLCEELDHPYRVIPVDFSAKYRASAEWRKLNPVGKVPAMVDGDPHGDGHDFTLFESGAMVQYLLDNYGQGRLQPPLGTPEHGLYMQWSWFAEATFARPLGEIVNHKRAFSKQPNEAIMEEMRNRARTCMSAVNEALRGNDYLLGDAFTAADIMMGYTMKVYQALVPDDLPAEVSSYWQRLISRPAYQAMEAADRNTAEQAKRQ